MTKLKFSISGDPVIVKPRTITMEVSVSSCRECPMRATVSDHGASFPVCSHPKAPEGYDNMIPTETVHNRRTGGRYQEDVDSFPSWCPG